MNDNVVVDIAYLYLSGMSLRNVAKHYNVSHITIRKKLLKKLPLIDRYLYSQVMDVMNKNNSHIVKDEEVQKRILRSYSKLVEEDKTVKDIAKEENTSYFTIYRDLTTRLPKMSNIDKKTLEKMHTLVLNTLKKHSASNLNQ